MNRISFALLFFLMLAPYLLYGQVVTVSGYVLDSDSGEPVPGAVIYTSDKKSGVSADENGKYSLAIPSGKVSIFCSSFGYKTFELSRNFRKPVRYDFILVADRTELESAFISSKSKRDAIKLPQIGAKTFDAKITRDLPSFMGEADIIRVIQMMPGVQAPSEGSTGFSVRGGGIDQNLVLIDGAPLYNSGHFLGFFSVFNSDVVSKADIFKGDFPASYGGRLSSVLDVRTVDGNVNSFGGNASIGLIASKIFVEGPIARRKAGFMISARRSYLDLFIPLFGSRVPKGSKLYFYDINAKLHWNVSEKDRLYLSGYTGDDVLGLAVKELELDNMIIDFRNLAGSLRWNHVFSSAVRSDATLYATDFKGDVSLDIPNAGLIYKQNVIECGVKYALSWNINPSNKFEAGVAFASYGIKPGEVSPVGKNSVIQNVTVPKINAVQPSLYAQNEQKLGPVALRYGLRLSSFTTTGPTEQRYFDPVTHELTDTVQVASGKPISTYWGLEPRFSASWSVTDNFSLKASYIRTFQYLQQLVISISGSPIDTWFTCSPNVKPQISDQFSAGVNALLFNDAIKVEWNLFYKNNKNTIDIKDNPGLVVNNVDREGLLRFGKGYACGTEIMLEYDFGKVNGWVGYTWSRAMYDIPEINDGKPYLSPLNHEHAVNLVCTYDITRRLGVSAQWVFYSGAPTTFPVGRYKLKDTYVPIYSSRNEDRMPDYHRLDVSISWKTKRRLEEKRWSGEWNLSVYNAYARHNAWSIAFGYDSEKQVTVARKVYLFSVIPSISYNIKF